MKAKGLIVKDFPHHWTNWINPDKENEYFTKEEILFNNKLIIEKRPYFMKYLYPKYKTQYNDYFKKYNYLSYVTFGIGIEELINLNNKTDEQKRMVENYNKFNPFLETNSPMNNICKYMEKEIKEIKINAKKRAPDYIFNILFNRDIEITETQIRQMENVYKKYKKSKSSSCTTGEFISPDELININKDVNDNNFDYISDDIQRLANLAVYVNYYLHPTAPKNFCWDLFGEGILFNIYDNSNNSSQYRTTIL